MNAYTERERRAFELGGALGLDGAEPMSLLRCGDIGRILAVRDPDCHHSGNDVELLAATRRGPGCIHDGVHARFWAGDRRIGGITQACILGRRRCVGSTFDE